MPLITATYASILALFFVGLSARVIQLRYKFRVVLGDGGEERLERAIRGQGNFAEYAPITLVLILCLELLQGPGWLIHATGVALVAGRLAHGICFAFLDSSMGLRRAGVILTFTAIIIAAVGNLVVVFARAS